MAAVEYDVEVEFVDIAVKHWKHSDDISMAVVHTVTAAHLDDDWILFACDRPLDMLVVNVVACDKRCFARTADYGVFCSRHLFDLKALPDGIHCLAFAVTGTAASEMKNVKEEKIIFKFLNVLTFLEEKTKQVLLSDF